MEFLAIFALLDSAGGLQGHDLGEEREEWACQASGGARQTDMRSRAAGNRTQQRPKSPFLGKSVGQKFARDGGRGK